MLCHTYFYHVLSFAFLWWSPELWLRTWDCWLFAGYVPLLGLVHSLRLVSTILDDSCASSSCLCTECCWGLHQCVLSWVRFLSPLDHVVHKVHQRCMPDAALGSLESVVNKDSTLKSSGSPRFHINVRTLTSLRSQKFHIQVPLLQVLRFCK